MSLVNNTNAKQTMKLQAMPMQELRTLLENELENKGFATYLTNMTESDLTLKVAKPSDKPTILSLTRHRHRPLEIEVTVDHKLLDSHDLITKKAKSPNTNTQQDSFMMYRWLWIGLLLFGIIISLFVLFVNIIVSLIESATPGWTSNQRSMGILSIATLILLWYVYVRPRVKTIDTRRRNQSDLYLLENIKTFIEGMAYQAPVNSLIRCWNCFEKIDPSETFCSFCGKQQN